MKSKFWHNQNFSLKTLMVVSMESIEAYREYRVLRHSLWKSETLSGLLSGGHIGFGANFQFVQ